MSLEKRLLPRQREWLQSQSQPVKLEAARRLAVVALVQAHEMLGLSRTAAIACAAAWRGVHSRTVERWMAEIYSLDLSDVEEMLFELAPRREPSVKRMHRRG